MSESTTIEETDQPATIESIANDLARLGVENGSLLLVHSSLSSLGWVSGGAVAVVEGLLKAVGPTGTLVMPSYSSHLSEPAIWENPPVPESWWPIIRETMPPYDPRTTPTAMGAIPELFRTLPDSVRGDHPQFSFTACGPLAREIVQPHSLDARFGEQSPLGRIYQSGGVVLLLGVDNDRNTSLHLAEERAFGDTAGTIQNGAPILVDGQRRWIELEQLDVPDNDFVQLGKLIRTTTKIIQKGKVGLADSQLMSQRDLVDFAVREWRDR